MTDNIDFIPGEEENKEAVASKAPVAEGETKEEETLDISGDVVETITEVEEDPEEKPKQEEGNGLEIPAEEDAKEVEAEKAESNKSALPVVDVEKEAAVRMTRGQRLRAREEQNQEREARTRERNEFLIGWDALNTARARNTVLRAPVVAVEIKSIGTKNPDGQARREVFLVTSINSRYKILIPFHEIYQDNPIDTTDTTNMVQRQRQMATKLLNSNIEFCITGLFPGNEPDFSDYLCSGSRRQALDIISRRNYRAPRGGSEPNLKVGSRTEATVVSVGTHALRVNVGGVDTQIPLWNLTFKYVNDLRDMYKAGDKIDVEIREVKERPDGKFDVTVSARSLEIENASKRLHLIGGRGTQVMATVTRVRYSRESNSNTTSFDEYRQGEEVSGGNGGRLVMYAHIASPLDLPARVYGMDESGLFRRLQAGDLIRVSVIGVADDGVVNCAFNAVHGSPGALLH